MAEIQLKPEEMQNYVRQLKDNNRTLTEDLRSSVLDRAGKLSQSIRFFKEKVLPFIDQEATADNPLAMLPLAQIPLFIEAWEEHLKSFREQYQLVTEAAEQIEALSSSVSHYLVMAEQLKTSAESLKAATILEASAE